MDKAETMSEKFAILQKEAEIPKTAPKPSPKAGEKPAKTWQKVAEITINPKTAKKIRLLLKRIDSLVGEYDILRGKIIIQNINGI